MKSKQLAKPSEKLTDMLSAKYLQDTINVCKAPSAPSQQLFLYWSDIVRFIILREQFGHTSVMYLRPKNYMN